MDDGDRDPPGTTPEARRRPRGPRRSTGATVDELIHELERTNPALEGWILDETGVIRPHINVFVNGERVKQDAAVGADDKIEILPAISGG